MRQRIAFAIATTLLVTVCVLIWGVRLNAVDLYSLKVTGYEDNYSLVSSIKELARRPSCIYVSGSEKDNLILLGLRPFYYRLRFLRDGINIKELEALGEVTPVTDFFNGWGGLGLGLLLSLSAAVFIITLYHFVEGFSLKERKLLICH